MGVLTLVLATFVCLAAAVSQGEFRNEWGIELKESDTTFLNSLGFTVVKQIGKLENTYLIRLTNSESTTEQIESADASLKTHPSVAYSEKQYKKVMSKRPVEFQDPLFSDQWHLLNTGQEGGTPGQDVHIAGAWALGYSGKGVRIAIVDDGYQYTHPDLAQNYAADSSYDMNGGNPDPAPDTRYDYHGTSAAGVALAAANSECGVGAAYDAQGAGIRLIANAFSDADTAEALTYMYQDNDIYSNSWGPYDDGYTLEGPGYFTRKALADAIQNGRGGKGTIYVWAGGNGLQANDNCNYDGFVNSRYTIGVGAVDNNGTQSYYSEPCSAILVTAPSSGTNAGITTTDLLGDDGYSENNCTNDFGGTSSATPLVAGVIALILEANSALSWIDVQQILVETAEKNDPTDGDWTTNGAGYHINHKYGFGRVNATAAVLAAQKHVALPTQSLTSYSNIIVNQTIPDGTGLGLNHTFSVSAGLTLQHVEVSVNIPNFLAGGDLLVVLTSPNGTKSILAEKHGYDLTLSGALPQVNPGYNYYLGSALFGPQIDAAPITVQVVVAQPSNAACGVITNCADLAGKFVLADRSPGCTYVARAYNLQTQCNVAGVVVANNVAGDPFTMGGNDDRITIPSVMISLAGGTLIKEFAQNNTLIELTITPTADKYAINYQGWTFSTVRNWGESSDGDWNLEVIDSLNGEQGLLESWSLNLYGYPTSKTNTDDGKVFGFEKEWVIGGSVGGGVLLIALIGLIAWRVRARNRRHYQPV